MEENSVRLDIVMVLNVKFVKHVILKEKQKLLQKNNYLFLLANRKDWIQRNVKRIPVINIIIFDKSAQNKFKKLPEKKLLKTSNPPSAVISPNNTTICIIIFILVGNNTAKSEKNKIGKPIIDGIKEV